MKTTWSAVCVLVLACVPAGTGHSTRAPSSSAPEPAATAPQAPTIVAAGYNKPPQHVLDVLHAPASPSPHMSPSGDRVLLVTWVKFPPISQVAEPYLKLAGVRLEPRTRRRHDTPGGYGINRCAEALTIVDVASGQQTPIELPEAGCADSFHWSADGQSIAFPNTSDGAVQLWLADVSGKALRLGDHRLNPMLGNTMQWMPDQKTLLVKLIPADAGAPPPSAAAVASPTIRETAHGGEFSTYEARDTLKSPADEALFEYYGTSQLALVDTTTGVATPVGKPAVVTEVDPAPDGAHILVTTIDKPYSYDVTYSRFAHSVAVWERDGATTLLAQLPVADHVPVHGVPTGPRNHHWRPTEPATLLWAEALDGGDWNVDVAARDKVMVQRAPFTQAATELTRTTQRFGGYMWLAEGGRALLSEYDANKQWSRTFVVDVDDPNSTPRLLWDLSYRDVYNAPGSPVYRVLPNGQWVVRNEGAYIFLNGEGSTPAGDRPFLDRLDLTTLKSERLFRSDPSNLEYFVAFTGDKTDEFLTWHQSPTDVPNLWMRSLGAPVTAAAAGEAVIASSRQRNVTNLPDPTPQIRSIKKRLVKYKRKDGVELSFTLYTPPHYHEGTPIPAVVYAYPLDYAEAGTAGQISGSDRQFTRLAGHQLLLLSGYAIIDDAGFPIVGDPKTAYDTYVPQLVENARAAVDKAVELGVVDPERIGVTGHSHGALMTVNLLTHTDLFRAGVATSGAYNKTLTPFGFQNERRSLWQARDVYTQASPLFHIDQLNEPLLLIHGDDDANPGTTPLQSEKLYEAIRGNGGTARLVMLPHEPHWYTARESNEQQAYEMLQWFDKYVKNATPRPKKAKKRHPWRAQ